MAKTTTPNSPTDSKSKQSQQAPSPIAENTVIPLTIPWSEIAPSYQASITKASKRLKIDGFRKGHVPPSIAQEYLNPDALAEDTARKVVPPRMPKLVEEAKIDLATQPEIQIKSATQGEDWQFDIILAPKPQIDVKDYQKIVKTAKKEGQQKWQESQKALDAEKKTSDTKKNQSTAKSTASNQSNSEGSVDQSNHDHDHDSDSPEKKAQQEKSFLLQTIYTQLVLELKPQIPELLIRQQAREELENLVKQLESIKMTLDDYLTQTQQTFEDLSGQITARVLGQLQLAFILQAVAKEAKIDVTEAEIDHEIDTLPEAKDLVANRANPRMRAYLRDSLLQKKIIDHLLTI